MTGKTKKSSPKLSVKQRCKTIINAFKIKPKSFKYKPKIDQSETSEAEDDAKDNDSEDESSDDEDPDYDYPDCPSSSCDHEVERKEVYEEMKYLQYSLITFPKLLNDNETRMYITKQLLFINGGWLAAKRIDIIDLLGRMFENNGHENQRYLPHEFIGNMEKEYGNQGNRNVYFNDKKYQEREESFNQFRFNRNQ